jgi:hypothetical protein
MNIEAANKIIQELENMGEEGTLYEDYSGRGMYGTTTVGIASDCPPVYIGYAAGAAGLEYDDVPHKMDSLGMGYIYY